MHVFNLQLGLSNATTILYHRINISHGQNILRCCRNWPAVDTFVVTFVVSAGVFFFSTPTTKTTTGAGLRGKRER